MELDIRLTNTSDYPELCDWWKWWPGWSAPPSIELLDNLKYGIMISLNNQNICAGFIYFTNARAFCLLEYVISSYIIKDREIRKEAKTLLLCSLIEMANKQGVKTIFSSVRHEALIKDYVNCGFIVGSKGTSELILNIK